MTLADLVPLAIAALAQGAVFGALFAAAFPPANTWLARRMGRDPGALAHMPFASRAYFGLAILAGSGFALVTLMGLVSDAAGLPEALRWIAAALFAAAAGGTVLLNAAMPRPPQAPSS